MSLIGSDPRTQLAFSLYENKGVYAVMIGSGISRTASIPTGWEITLDLVRRIGLAQGEEEQDDWAQWYREKTGKEPNYSDLLADIAISPEERRSILHSYIEPTEQEAQDGLKVPTAAHLAIADLVKSGHVRVIITTNFDRLMENALREKGVEPTVISSVDALAGAEPLTHSRCYLLKIHGDYKDARILNTDEELSAYPEEYGVLLNRIFDEHGLIVCGWSGEWDHALRAAILRVPARRYPVFWASRGRVGDGAKELINHRRAIEIQIDGADEFFGSIAKKVEILNLSRQENPIKINLLIDMVKRALPKQDSFIQLDDIVSGELGHLSNNINSSDLSAMQAWSKEEFNRRVSFYESSAEGVVKIGLMLGRWGRDEHRLWALEILKNLVSTGSKNNGGNTVWLNLRLYPAVLFFYGYGLGLVRAEKWGELHKLFREKVVFDGRDAQLVVRSLFLEAWNNNTGLWRELEGLEKRRTPLSDHLYDLFSSWKNGLVGVDLNFEVLFGRFEMLGSLAYFEENELLELESAYQKSNGQIFAGMPLGRVGWNGTVHNGLIKALEADGWRAQILSAEFADGHSRKLDLFLENFKRACGRMLW
ncbi:SIR2 family protein [Chromobacterium vaccinii]|uniref:SIR2 family protein n=1 Tax=Chromobacterium vaccinii TaxID=1108595 RepID=UPI0009F539F6|nr:SIR2 family protein [Chromobacterium vaccinii]